MADDDAGGTVLGFPGGLTIPGPVGSGPPAPGADAPTLTALPTLAPPPSLLVAGNSDVGAGGDTTTAHADPGIPDSPHGTGIAAMSVVMMAGITVAAMRGAWNAAAYLKARHEHHRAIADQQRAAADKAEIAVEAARQKNRLQPGPEFGRSTRTSGGGGGRTNSGKNSAPSTFRSPSGSKSPGGSGSKTPTKAPGGASGGRTPSLGIGGRGGGGGGRRGALEPSGTKGGVKPGVGGGKTPTTGTKNSSGSLSGAVRDRAADRIRNGPKPKNGTGTTGTSGKSGGGGGATPSSGSKPGRGPGAKTSPTGSKPGTGTKPGSSGTKPGTSGTKPGPSGTKPGSSGTGSKPGRKRPSSPAPSTGRKGKGKKGGGKPGAAGPPKRKGKGRVTLPAAIAAESARRLKKRRKHLTPVLTTFPKGKKKKPAPAGTATPGTPKVDLTKKPKPSTTTAKPKVSLTKKPKPATTTAPKVNLRKKVRLTKKPRKPGPGAPAGPTGTASKVNLRKKVKLTKKPRKPGPGPAAGPTGSTGPTGSASKRKGDRRRSLRGWWERAGARRSGRPDPEPSSSTSSTTTSGPDAAPAGGFGPPPGWGYAEGTTITVEQTGGQVWEARQREARRRASVPAGAIPAARTGGTVVTVPIPTKAPSTQYADSDLTIYDVIDSDADMAEEIMAGVDEARAAADGCEQMMTRLEALHAKIVELKVPGVLEGWVLILAEKAVSVKAKAEALAEKLPAASEAIWTAGENAERRHKPLADAVRDAGHAAPAERDYHVE
ncbi:hypothetical protein [Streptomyces katrae]|uniref:hypothetical protein n=1 Tax=Streptomyces katrae TaxID=68223 RepID=UPI0004C00BDC|nr:hypothetical protein [Streptomyces katrae]